MTGSLGEVLKEALARKWAEDDAAHKQMEEAKPAPAPTGKKLFPVTNNLSRATFNHIKYNPATRAVITDELKSMGYKYSSIASVISQMVKQKLVTIDSAGVLHAIVPEYMPLKSSNVFKKAKPVKAKQPKRPVSSSPAGLAAIVPALVPVPEPTPARPLVPVLGWSTDEILENLDVKQAVAVYKELKKLFGEVK